MLNRFIVWYRRLFQLEISSDNVGAVIANSYGINRRRYTRVLFPESTAAVLPRLTYKSQDLPIINLSTGGTCVEDHFDQILASLGDTIELQWDWLNWSFPIALRIVGASRHVHRHLEFTQIPQELRDDLSLLVQAGGIGQRLTQAPNIESAPVRLGVAELWTTNTGDNLRIVESETEYGSLSTASEDWIFPKGGAPVWRPAGSNERLREATPISIACLIILLCNIQEPSLPVRQLRLLLSRMPIDLKATGSDE